MATLFVSDLHLCAERPAISASFFGFVAGIAPSADAVYILGDLFEYWLGDDDTDDPLNATVAGALEALTRKGVKVFFMHGNRDPLLGRAFTGRCGAVLIPDPTLIDLHGTRTLLMHGDTLCTDDVEYQNFRVYARDPENQARFLALPLAARRAQALELRGRSERSKQAKAEEIMDVSLPAVEEALRDHGYPRLIHGHTHRPAKHVHVVDGHSCERWVLNDWYRRGGYLRCDASGCTAITLD
jgi:UDP-2,3-diacylglucosamine hydrolase